jgi:hypothetical protein
MKKLVTIFLILSQVSCGTRFDIHGVGHEKLKKEQKQEQETAETSDSKSGCMKDSDCKDGKVCATVKGELPGSCAGKTSGSELMVGALIIGAAAAAAANSNSSGGSSYAPTGRGNDVWVNGYYNQYGTYVPGHWRSAPNETRTDNYGAPSRYSQGLYDRDTDGDGIYNQYDIDDDNDGINDDYDY